MRTQTCRNVSLRFSVVVLVFWPALGLAAEPTGPTWSGVAQIDLRHGSAPLGSNASAYELNARRVRLSLKSPASGTIGYNLTLRADNFKEATILDLHADVRLEKRLTLRVGQFKYDVDIEGRESISAMPLVDRAFVTNAAVGSLDGTSTASSTGSSFRDRGAALIGKFDLGRTKWTGVAGVFQGSGLAADVNERPALTGQVQVAIDEGLRFSVGIARNDMQKKGETVRSRCLIYTGGAGYDRGRFFGRAEYYAVRRDKDANDEKARGFYVSAGTTLQSSFDVVLRYQQLDDERYVKGGKRMRSVDGEARYYLSRKQRRAGTFVALSYMLRSADPGAAAGVTSMNDGRGVKLSEGYEDGNVLVVRLQMQF